MFSPSERVVSKLTSKACMDIDRFSTIWKADLSQNKRKILPSKLHHF